MEKIAKVANLNPRVWGVTVQVKVLKRGAIRTVKFKDESSHKVAEFLVGDDSGTILLNLWDDKTEEFEEGKVYEISEANVSVFNNSMKLNMSRKSQVTHIEGNAKVDESNNLSEKFVEQPKKFGKYKNYRE